MHWKNELRTENSTLWNWTNERPKRISEVEWRKDRKKNTPTDKLCIRRCEHPITQKMERVNLRWWWWKWKKKKRNRRRRRRKIILAIIMGKENKRAKGNVQEIKETSLPTLNIIQPHTTWPDACTYIWT